MEFTNKELVRVPHESSAWRWVIIGSVFSFQGAAVLQLRGHDTSATAMLSEHSQKKMQAWRDSDQNEPAPFGKLAVPKTLLKRIISTDFMAPRKPTACSEDQVADIEALIDLRNEFVHFVPKGWSLQVDGLPRMLSSCWLCVDSIIHDDFAYAHQLDESSMNRLKSATKIALMQIERLEALL